MMLEDEWEELSVRYFDGGTGRQLKNQIKVNHICSVAENLMRFPWFYERMCARIDEELASLDELQGKLANPDAVVFTVKEIIKLWREAVDYIAQCKVETWLDFKDWHLSNYLKHDISANKQVERLLADKQVQTEIISLANLLIAHLRLMLQSMRCMSIRDGALIDTRGCLMLFCKFYDKAVEGYRLYYNSDTREVKVESLTPYAFIGKCE